MSDEQPWSDNPNAPQIPYDLYFGEKANFAGILVGAILYGTRKTSKPMHVSVDAHGVCSATSRSRYRTFLPLYGGVD